MISRNELAELLRNRLYGNVPQDKIDQLVGEILSLETEWEEVDVPHRDMGYTRSSSGFSGKRRRKDRILNSESLLLNSCSKFLLETEWEEVDVPHQDMGYTRSDLCSSICWLADQTDQGSVIRFQRKKKRKKEG